MKLKSELKTFGQTSFWMISKILLNFRPEISVALKDVRMNQFKFILIILTASALNLCGLKKAEQVGM